MSTTTSQCTNLITQFEGFRPSAYFCPAGRPTIGFGTTIYRDGQPVGIGDETDLFSAEMELTYHVRRYVEPTIDQHFGSLGLQANQRDALGSFIHNIGSNSAKWPTLKRLIVENAPIEEISDQWVKYRLSGGRRLLGLYRRRLAEVLLWHGLPWQAALEATWQTNWRSLADWVDPYVQKVQQGMTTQEANETELNRVTPREERETPALPPPTPSAAPVSPSQPTIAVPAEQVPYAVNQDRPVKSLEDSKRVMGHVYEQVGTSVVRVGAGLGIGSFGFVGADPVLSNALVALFVVAAVAVTGYIIVEYGKWKKWRGLQEAESLLV